MLAIVLVKLLVHELGFEFISLSSIYTSAVAGGIFVIGLIVAGTLSDYKEADKVPAGSPAASAVLCSELSPGRFQGPRKWGADHSWLDRDSPL